MNQKISLLLLLVTMLFISPISHAAVQCDANGDDKISILDVVAIINSVLSGGEANAGTDCNNDGTVNIQDVVQSINLVLNPPKPTPKVNVGLFLFGQGAVVSHDELLFVDPSNVESKSSKTLYEQSDSQQLIFTATPEEDSEIAGWNGCDLISEDLTTCTVALNANQQVMAKFKYKTVETTATVYDLILADIVVSVDSIDVTALSLNDALALKLAEITVGDFVAGDENEGFLRKVTAIQKIDETHYIFSTVEASLDEVISKGTVLLSKQMTHSDLPSAPQGRQAKGTYIQLENALAGVSLLPSKNPDETEFIIQVGNPIVNNAQQKSSEASKNIDVDLIPGVLKASGSIAVKLKVNVSVDFSLFNGVNQFSLLLEPDITEKLKLTASADINHSVEKKIADLTFKNVFFMAGPVPVWIKISAPVLVGADGSIKLDEMTLEYTASQHFSSGFIYNEGQGIETVFKKSGTTDLDFSHKTTLEGKLKGYISFHPGVRLYGSVGPSFPIDLSIEGETEGSADIDLSDLTTCLSAEANLSVGLNSRIKFELGFENTSFSEKLGIDNSFLSRSLFDAKIKSRIIDLAKDASCRYIKLDANGNDLPSAASSWSCVRDKNTGLIWEVKTTDGGIHDKENIYRWGGVTALGDGSGDHFSDWNGLVNGSNASALCGASGWRVPNLDELKSLIMKEPYQYQYLRYINLNYFPYTASHVWSSSPYVNITHYAWDVFFYGGHATGTNCDASLQVRLVHSGQ